MAWLHALALRIGGLGWLPRALPVITHVDLALQRLTGGRLGLLDLAGLPNVLLEVRGRRTGVMRRTPLLCAVDGSDVIIAGSNFGLPEHPAWALNLAASRTARIRRHGRWTEIAVHQETGPARAAARERLISTWPNFRLYEQATSRRIRIFRLTPLS